jgi:hypothetical protein
MQTLKPMYEKNRLLKQFALPTSQTQAFEISWIRPNDLFGDSFHLHARIEANSIDFKYIHSELNAPSHQIWAFRLETLNGRARVASVEGEPGPLKTIHHAVELIGKTHEQMKAVPQLIALSTKLKSKRQKQNSIAVDLPRKP